MSKQRKRTPWLLWPVVALWNLITWILTLTTRFVAAILGLVLVTVGAILTVTIIGAVAGIPLIIFGLMLMIRSIF
jgi:hypothetical protein